MFYFPTKEHLLAVLVHMLCDYQWKLMQNHVEEGNTSLMALCLELSTMAAMCEDDEIAKDLYLSAYTHPLTIDIIRKNDAARAKQVFGEYCPDWDDQHFAAAEVLVSGIEYATLMTTGESLPMDIRISGGLNSILTTYQVPEEIRRTKIRKTLAIDYRTLGKQVLENFKNCVEETNEQAFEEHFRR